jgi:adenylosuccinate synthase
MRCAVASGLPEFDGAELKAKLMDIAPQLTPYMAPVWKLLDVARRAGQRILFEGRARRAARC